MTNLGQFQWTSASPTITMVPGYDMRRSGEDMQYKIYLTVNTMASSAYFGFPIYLRASLDGVFVIGGASNGVVIKSSAPSSWASPITYESEWFTISNKTSGTTALDMVVYSGSGSSRSQAQSYALPIEQAGSTISAFANFNISTATNGISITINNYAQTHTHQVRLIYKSLTLMLTSTKVGGGVQSFTLTQEQVDAIYEQMPSSISGIFTAEINTWNGNSLICGWTSKTAVGTIPLGVAPTMDAPTYERVDGVVPSGWGVYVQGKSKVSVLPSNVVAPIGTTISRVTLSTDGVSITMASPDVALETGFLPNSGSVTFSLRAYDTRGRSCLRTFTIYVYPYLLPSFSAISTQRCDSSGVVGDAEGFCYYKPTFTTTMSSCGGHNSVTITAKYKVSSQPDSAFSASEVVTSSFVYGGGDLSVDSSYTIRYSITDALSGTTAIDDYISVTKYLAHIKRGGTAIGLGCVSGEDGTIKLEGFSINKAHQEQPLAFALNNTYGHKYFGYWVAPIAVSPSLMAGRFNVYLSGASYASQLSGTVLSSATILIQGDVVSGVVVCSLICTDGTSSHVAATRCPKDTPAPMTIGNLKIYVQADADETSSLSVVIGEGTAASALSSNIALGTIFA